MGDAENRLYIVEKAYLVARYLAMDALLLDEYA
jgi:hypothetical protein